MTATRRLAAILAADVAGYSRLMGADEEGTLERLKALPMRLGSTALATERVERRLAAILAADVAGYSRLMGADEEGTLARLKAVRRELADPKIKEHLGRIVKTTGDGLLIEFASVVDAVRCAVEVQREMAECRGFACRKTGVLLGDKS